MDPSQKSTPGPTPIAAFGIVGELGYIIAVPALLFGFGGAYIDKYFGTAPLISGASIAYADDTVEGQGQGEGQGEAEGEGEGEGEGCSGEGEGGGE
jgi:hypothetical protein